MTLAFQDQASGPSPLAAMRLRKVFRRQMTGAVLVLAALGLVASVLAAMPQAPAHPPIVASARARSLPAWVEIVRPAEIFDLDAAEFANTARRYAAQRERLGSGRRDVLAFGAPGDPGLSLRLLVERHGPRPDRTPRPLFAVVVAHATEEAAAVTKAGLPGLLPTRFGEFEAMDASLSRTSPVAGQSPGQAACTGFRLVVDTPGLDEADLDKPALAKSVTTADGQTVAGLTITGLACEGTRPLTRTRLGCLLDRLDFKSAGDDRALIDFFAASELKRNATCDGMRRVPTRRTPVGRTTDGPHRPKLRVIIRK